MYGSFERLGCDGNGASIGKFAQHHGVSHGSIVNFTSRVFEALLSLHDNVIWWPRAEERAAISRRFASSYGLPNAVGIVDGTPVHFSQKPAVDGEVFYTRKGRYFNATIIFHLYT